MGQGTPAFSVETVRLLSASLRPSHRQPLSKKPNSSKVFEKGARGKNFF
jgi:hypothetical protein